MMLDIGASNTHSTRGAEGALVPYWIPHTYQVPMI